MVAACQTAGHDGGHRPGDHGPVVVREALVVADGAAVAADPGEGALHHPAARQHLEGVGQAPADDVDPKAQGGSRPDHQLARVAGVGQTSRMRRCATRSRHSSGWAPSRSWMLAAVTTIASSNPRVSTAMWRLRPLTFLPASKLRLAAGVHADLVAEGVVDVVQGAVGGPAGKEPVDGAPGWEVGWQRPPHTAV